MPGTSLKFPAEQRSTFVRAIHAVGNLNGFIHYPDDGGDVTNAAVASIIHHLSTFIWDGLGFLDIIDQQQAQTLNKLSVQQAQIASIQQSLNTLITMLAP